MTRQPHFPSPYIVLAIGVLAVSTASIFIRYAQVTDTPSLVIAAFRLSLASLLLTPYTLRRYHAELKGLSRIHIGLALLSGALLAVHFASWITSLEHVSVMVSVVLVTTNPLWVALFAPILLHEPISRRTAIGISIAFAGGILISLSSNDTVLRPEGTPLLGSLLALLGAVTAALYLIIGRRLRASLDLIPYIWLVYSTAAVILLLTVLLSGRPLLGYAPDAYLWMLMLALIPQLIGHSSFNYALKHVSAAYVSLVILGEPIGSTVLAAIFLGEMPAWLQVIGAGLILFAIVFARQEEPALPDEEMVVAGD